MKPRTLQWSLLILTLAAVLLGGCKKKVEPPPPPTAPPPPAPTASLAANPNAIVKGQSTILTWRTSNAAEVSIEGIGTVDPDGSRPVSPEASVTYRLIARGPGGTQEATARVTVTEAPTAPPVVSETEAQMFARNVKDVFFDYDQYDIRPDADRTMRDNARFLTQHPNLRFIIEGHCDERGSIEYNLTLGDSRALATRDALVRLGVSADRIRVVSFGKEKPFCTQPSEDCWQQNRRGHFVLEK
ncbi:MAG: peptidoglycan-associated lipoprotein Pal [Acidobacteria bacterium]|nr:peptidoglycan-associated lipoprotein Pal [Acidobacteriota bacterium]